MKIFIISEMTIYSELQQLCESNSIQIEKKLALKMVPAKYNISELDSMIYSSDGLVFQSKNAINFCKNNHMAIQKRIELDSKEQKTIGRLEIYCNGKYSAEEIRQLFNVSPKFNPSDFSSEGMLKTIKEDYNAGYTFVIIKGLGGRNHIEDELTKSNIFVRSYYVYERVYADFSINDKNLDIGNNYFFIGSLTALKGIQDKLGKIISKKRRIAIIPTERIANKVNDATFDDCIIINNTSSAQQYMHEIIKYEKR